MSEDVGAMLLVGPSGPLAERVREYADMLGTPLVEWDADPDKGVIAVESDPLGEVRVDGVAIALARTAGTETGEGA